jgi:hypothetical protein
MVALTLILVIGCVLAVAWLLDRGGARTSATERIRERTRATERIRERTRADLERAEHYRFMRRGG